MFHILYFTCRMCSCVVRWMICVAAS
jgi:hypothetical protein